MTSDNNLEDRKNRVRCVDRVALLAFFTTILFYLLLALGLIFESYRSLTPQRTIIDIALGLILTLLVAFIFSLMVANIVFVIVKSLGNFIIGEKIKSDQKQDRRFSMTLLKKELMDYNDEDILLLLLGCASFAASIFLMASYIVSLYGLKT